MTHAKDIPLDLGFSGKFAMPTYKDMNQLYAGVGAGMEVETRIMHPIVFFLDLDFYYFLFSREVEEAFYIGPLHFMWMPIQLGVGYELPFLEKELHPQFRIQIGGILELLQFDQNNTINIPVVIGFEFHVEHRFNKTWGITGYIGDAAVFGQASITHTLFSGIGAKWYLD